MGFMRWVEVLGGGGFLGADVRASLKSRLRPISGGALIEEVEEGWRYICKSIACGRVSNVRGTLKCCCQVCGLFTQAAPCAFLGARWGL
jgi:hypothetical protein